MLFKQIEQNKRKTLLLIGIFIVLALAFGAAFGYFKFGNWQIGVLTTGIVAGFYVPITVMSAKVQVLAMSGAREADRETYKQLYNIVEELCIPAQLPMPKVYVIQDDAPNAFATGFSPKSSAVAFTTGLLDKLTREELEAVAAHELGHIRNFDIRLMTITIALVGVIALLAEIGLRMLAFGGDRRDRDRKQNPVLLIIALVFVILAPLAAQFVQLAVSRNREYLADATAVEFTRNSAGMISALQKIADSNPRLKVKRAKKATASMYITNPFNEDRQKQSFSSWFATHPPIPERIARLEQM